MGQRSRRILSIRLPSPPSTEVLVEDVDGRSWSRQVAPPPDDLAAATVWRRVREDRARRHEIVSAAGAALAAWLLDARAAELLEGMARSWRQPEPRLRVELTVPQDLVPWPWESLHLPGLGALAAHPALTVVRRSPLGDLRGEPVRFEAQVHLVGVALTARERWPSLATAEEIERLRLEIESAGEGRRLVPEVDALGSWEELWHRYRSHGPGHVFHFAGHGLPDGRGLVFRGKDGMPEEVPASRIANLLSVPVQGRRTQLVFLNACTTMRSGEDPLQPFGGLAEMLVRQGVPAVVAVQVPIEDSQAPVLSTTFYRRLVEGFAVDCALQAAREQLYLGSFSVAWAFVSLTLAAEPEALLRLDGTAPAAEPSATHLAFGHEKQRLEMERILKRRLPVVVVIHGEARSGHRHVTQRLRHDLVRDGNLLWEPVPVLHWFVPGEPRLSRQQLAGGIASALYLYDGGTQDEVEARIAEEIARCAGGDQVVVFDLLEPVSLRDEAQADALVALVQELWADLMERAAKKRREQRGATLPVFLLLPVAYPRPLPTEDPRAGVANRRIDLTRRAVQRLGEQPRLHGQVRVKVLPTLEPFGEAYVADFLEEVLELSPEEAQARAADLVSLDDNEAILARMDVLLRELERI
jgi:hypothetical protein